MTVKVLLRNQAAALRALGLGRPTSVTDIWAVFEITRAERDKLTAANIDWICPLA